MTLAPWISLAVSLLAATPALPASDSAALHLHDEVSSLGEPARGALEALLREHEQLTGERIVVAILKEGGQDPGAAGREYYAKHLMPRLGRQGLGAALVIAGPREGAVIEAGVGLESLLNESVRRRILERRLDLGAGRIDSALALSVVEILRAVESPLIASGRAQEILEGMRLVEDPGPGGPASLWALALLLAAGLTGITFAVLAVGGPEIHCSSEGTHRLASHARLATTISALTSRGSGHGGESVGHW